MIHMKYQDLISLKNNIKNLECRLPQILLKALRVKSQYFHKIVESLKQR